MPEIVLIAAMDRARGIGVQGDLPWRLPDDLKRFKQRTLGCPVIMGRKTWDSLPFPLPGRRNLVLTRQTDFSEERAEVFFTIDALLASVESDERVFVIGGGEIYTLFLPRADVLDLTLVDTRVEGADAWFPAFEETDWRIVESNSHAADDDHRWSFVWQVMERLK